MLNNPLEFFNYHLEKCAYFSSSFKLETEINDYIVEVRGELERASYQTSLNKEL
jgi:hypothetical protein